MKKKEEEKLQTSFFQIKNYLIEECYKEKEGVCFAVWDGNEVKYEKEIDIDGVVYIPIIAEEVQKKAILLPSKAEEYGTDEELDNEIKQFINKWLDIPEDVLQFALWNIKRSWIYDRFHTLNYLRALGDTGMGKTRFLDTLGYIHYKPIETSGATTAAPVFRMIEKWRGTLIMDEADLNKSDETQDIIKIINLGYERGKHVMRCDQNDASKINFFDPYCPKILATRRSFTDKATESRCITTIMKGTSKEIPLNLNEEFFETAQKLRNKLLMWRFNNFFKVDPNKKVDMDLDLEPRVRQIVNSFVSLFGDDEQQLESFKVFIKKYQEDLIEERRNSFAGAIVGAIFALIDEGKKDINTKDIIEEAELVDTHPRGVANILKSLGFENTIPKKVNGKTKRCINLNQDLLINLGKRYGYEVTMVTIDMVSPDYQQKIPVTVVSALPMYRNHRNFVTENHQKDILKPILQKLDVKYYVRCNICSDTPIGGCEYEINGQLICDDCAKSYVNS